MVKKTVFNKLWLDAKLHPELANWLQEGRGGTSEAFCKLCSMTVQLSNMGRRALVSHASSVKHRKIVDGMSVQKQPSLSSFSVKLLQDQPSTSKSGIPDVPEDQPGLITVKSTEVISKQCNSGSAATDKVVFATEAKVQSHPTIASYVSGDDVMKAEILWAMKCVTSHFSMNSARDIKDIFQMMFPDSSIAKKITVGSTKLSYYITYGLSPYFHNQLLRAVSGCEKFVICFDEAFNRISQRGQMDVCIRFWDANSNTVLSRYFGSAFMGFASAEHILASFKEALTELPLNRILQVSMDGPAVNWKFMDLLRALEDAEVNPIDLGSCGLHVVNGGFQTGHKASGWHVNAYLRAIYCLFKDSPARRAAYKEITGSSVFPLKFCQVRWLENAACAEQAMEMLPHIKKFVENSKRLSDAASSTTVKELCADKLAGAKLAFFASVASQCEPFLRKFQTAKPIAPFLYYDIGNLLRVLMKRFIKRSIMETSDKVADLRKVDLSSKDTRCTYKEVDVGVGATKCLSLSKLSETEKMGFQMQCIEFLSAAVSKIFERGPLKYSIVRAISCLVPATVANCRGLAESRMKLLVEIMYEKGCITAVTGDKCKSQFSDLCAKASGTLKSRFASYSTKVDRLDVFYYDIIGQDAEFVELFSVVKLVLILSHGNASVESGFSVNKDMLVENLHEESLVAQRTVYQAVQCAGGITSVVIDKNMLSYVRGSHARYEEALGRKRKAAAEADKQTAAKRKLTAEIKQLEIKKSCVMKEAASEAGKIDSEITKLLNKK